MNLPSRISVRDSFRGFGRAAAIRTLYAERCSLAEIAVALGVDDMEVRRVLRRPATKPVARWDITGRMEYENGKLARKRA